MVWRHGGARRVGVRPVDCTTCHAATVGSPTTCIPGDKGPQDACGVFGVWAARRRGRQADLLRALRPAAPRPGVGRHRGQRRVADRGLQGHGPRLPGLRRAPRSTALRRPPRHRPHPLLDDRRQHLGERAADVPLDRRPARSRSAHNGNLTNTGDLADARGERARPTAASCLRRTATGDSTDRHRPDHRAARVATPTARSSRRRSRCCRSCAARSRSSSWTRRRSTPPATRRASARSCSAGSSAAGSSPARPPRSTSSAPAFVREVEPGELIAIDEHGLRIAALRGGRPQGLPVRVRLPRPAGHHDRRPQRARGAGRGRAPARAREHPVEADLVIPVPESGTPAAIGYAAGQRHPVTARAGEELLRRAHLHPAVADDPPARHPAQAQPAARRHRAASGWSSSTTRSCAATPSARWSACCARPAPSRCTCASPSPPVKWPCFYGIDFATRAELIANGLDVEEIRASIGADSLGLRLARGPRRARPTQPMDRLCRACFDGEYPIELPEPELLGKHLLEGLATAARGAADALSRRVAAWPTRATRRRARATGPLDSCGRRRGATYAAAGVDIEAGDRAVELMKASVARARRPEVVGGLGGFAGLFDASRSPRYRRPLLATSTDGVGTKVAIAAAHGPARHDRHRPGRHGRRRPRGLRRRAAVHDRLHRLRQGRPGADRGDRRRASPRAACWPAARWSAARPPSTRGCSGRTSTTSPAPAPAWSRPTSCSAPDRVRAGDVAGRDGARPACTPTATRWSATCCSRRAGWALDRHVAELGRTLGEELLEPTRIYALDCLALARGRSTCTRSRTSPAAGSRPTSPGCCRPTLDGRSSTGPPGRRRRSSGWSAELGRVARDELERTLNLGVGMVAVVAADGRRSRRAARWRERGMPAWVAGTVTDRRAGGDGRRPGSRWSATRLGASAWSPRGPRRRTRRRRRVGVVVRSRSDYAESTRAGAAPRCRRIEVGPVRAVLQLAGNLGLLGLGPAAPHGSTPSCYGATSTVRVAGSGQLRERPSLPQRSAGSRYVVRATDATARDAAPARRRRSPAGRAAGSGAASRPTAAIRASASRSAATAGGTPVGLGQREHPARSCRRSAPPWPAPGWSSITRGARRRPGSRRRRSPRSPARRGPRGRPAASRRRGAASWLFAPPHTIRPRSAATRRRRPARRRARTARRRRGRRATSASASADRSTCGWAARTRRPPRRSTSVTTTAAPSLDQVLDQVRARPCRRRRSPTRPPGQRRRRPTRARPRPACPGRRRTRSAPRSRRRRRGPASGR